VNLKTACLLLGVCHAGFAAALGLGDVAVRSYLGQPLHAVVPLIGATDSTTTDCLSIAPYPGGIAPLPRAELTIESAGGEILLHIRTARSVNDPVAQFVLISECEVRLQREYVVLLDPPGQSIESASSSAIPEAEPQIRAEPENAAAAAVSEQRPARRATSAPPRAAVATQRAPAPQPPRATAPTQARLVLSGKRADVESPLALRPDKRLSEPGQPVAETLNPTDLSEENTALNRRIAYLETQLRALQERNARLDRARAATPLAAPPPAAKPSPQWPLYLLAAGVLAGVGIMIAALRRRSSGRSQAVNLIDDNWAQPDLDARRGSPGSDLDSIAPAAPRRMAEMAAPPGDNGTELKEDILDQAEVFMAHGHGELAIHLLQEHLRESPNESPVPWLLLLDLLHRAGDTAGYTAASTECRRYFNVNLDGRAFFNEADNGQGIEAYPHLLEKMVQVWNTPDIKAFFDDLVFDHRGGTRIGFEPGVYRDILLLRSIAQDIAPVQLAA
jgi:Tfp pilus assembly protein FimV